MTSTIKMPWIFLIMVFPIMGLTLYLLVGLNGGTSKMRKRYQKIDEQLLPLLPENHEILEKLQQSIAALTKGKTLLVIAHRLSTIQTADQIVVLQAGEILAKGTQEKLLVNCPLYQKMWKLHIGAKHWAVSQGRKEDVSYV